jgi:hypothetical protein
VCKDNVTASGSTFIRTRHLAATFRTERRRTLDHGIVEFAEEIVGVRR